jgi:hypothetical protein
MGAERERCIAPTSSPAPEFAVQRYGLRGTADPHPSVLLILGLMLRKPTTRPTEDMWLLSEEEQGVKKRKEKRPECKAQEQNL